MYRCKIIVNILVFCHKTKTVYIFASSWWHWWINLCTNNVTIDYNHYYLYTIIAFINILIVFLYFQFNFSDIVMCLSLFHLFCVCFSSNIYILFQLTNTIVLILFNNNKKCITEEMLLFLCISNHLLLINPHQRIIWCFPGCWWSWSAYAHWAASTQSKSSLCASKTRNSHLCFLKFGMSTSEPVSGKHGWAGVLYRQNTGSWCP